MKRILNAILFSGFCGAAFAQDMPNHDIVMFDLLQNAKGEQVQFELQNNVTIASSRDYENQPHFISNDEILFTRMRGENADVWRWRDEVLSQASETLESEYSPTLIPFMEGEISMIRVEHDGTQRLWKYDLDGSFELLFKDIKPVGYHAWNEKNIAMFVLGEPHRLEITKLGQEKTTVLDQDIGRCLQAIPGTNQVSYTKVVNDRHQLRSINFQDKSTSEIFMLPAGAQDYVWIDENTIISSDGTSLMWRKLDQKSGWNKVQNTGKPLSNITRLAISPNSQKLAVVHAQ